jgi:hypothetical protein
MNVGGGERGGSMERTLKFQAIILAGSWCWHQLVETTAPVTIKATVRPGA